MDLSFTIEEIAEITEPIRRVGRSAKSIHKIASLEEAQDGDLSFLGNMRYRKEVATSGASLIFVPAEYKGTPKEGQVFFFVEDPSLALAKVCHRIEGLLRPRPLAGIDSTASIASGAEIAESATIGPQVVIEEGVTIGERAVLQGQVFVGRDSVIGDDSFLAARVTILDRCRIGERVRIDSGAVIGSEGYGYHTDSRGQHEKLPQIGEVWIGNDVEIGANTTIDRARFSRTEIGEGTKIDNLVQIGHNVVVGKHCLIVAQVGIAGSTKIEDHVIIGGQAGLVGHITVGRGSMIGAQAGINRTLEPKSYVTGTPAMPHILSHKVFSLSRRLPDLFRDVSKIEKKIEELSKEA